MSTDINQKHIDPVALYSLCDFRIPHTIEPPPVAKQPITNFVQPQLKPFCVNVEDKTEIPDNKEPDPKEDIKKKRKTRKTECPSCNREIKTKVKNVPSECGQACCVCCILLGGFLGCCLIPYCFCRDFIHVCPECNHVVYERNDPKLEKEEDESQNTQHQYC